MAGVDKYQDSSNTVTVVPTDVLAPADPDQTVQPKSAENLLAGTQTPQHQSALADPADTGDHNAIAIWVALLLVAAASGVITVKIRKSRK